jgi:peptidoglycan/xylan/chitin deacetylase (PgdA/CDA1 family)
MAESRDPLERLLGLVETSTDASGQQRPRVQALGGRDDLATWLAEREWRVFARPARELVSGGQEIAQFQLPSGEVLSASFDAARNSVFVPFSAAEAYLNYLTEAWSESIPRRGLSSAQLNAFYRVKRFIPRRLQIRGRRMLVRRTGLPGFPRWPFDTSVTQLLRFYAYCVLLGRGETEADFRWFWPNSHRAAVILTHDVETAEGLPLAVELADLEQAHGFRSSFNLGGWYKVDPGITRELTGRGFEIGMHGLRHDRTLFSSRAAFDAQRPELASLAERLGAEGFRSPSTYRVFEWIAELPISYDGSIPHSDPFEPQPGGCCSIWPFFIGSLVELPYTLPQDHTLLTLLGHRNADVWIEGARRIEEGYGLIQCLSHPDRGYLGDPPKRAIYAEFLRAIAERERVWKALPRDVASWWRERDAAGTVSARTRAGSIRADDGAAAGVLSPPD